LSDFLFVYDTKLYQSIKPRNAQKGLIKGLIATLTFTIFIQYNQLFNY